jgi:hypothetical protein
MTIVRRSRTGARRSAAVAGLAVVLLTAGCSSSSHVTSSAPAGSGATLITRHSLAGIELGRTQAEVERLTGPGRGVSAHGVKTVAYSLPAGRLSVDYGILFADDPSRTVLDASTAAPGFRTAEGVGVGSSLHDVNALGAMNCAPTDNRHTQCQTLAHGPGLEFDLLDERVIRVTLLRRIN